MEVKDKPVENIVAASPMIQNKKRNDLSGSEWDKNIMNTEGNPDVAESSLNIREDDLIAKQINEARFNSKFSNQI